MRSEIFTRNWWLPFVRNSVLANELVLRKLNTSNLITAVSFSNWNWISMETRFNHNQKILWKLECLSRLIYHFDKLCAGICSKHIYVATREPFFSWQMPKYLRNERLLLIGVCQITQFKRIVVRLHLIEKSNYWLNPILRNYRMNASKCGEGLRCQNNLPTFPSNLTLCLPFLK